MFEEQRLALHELGHLAVGNLAAASGKTQRPVAQAELVRQTLCRS